MGQGGWASYELVRTVGQPATVALRSAIPLEVDLDVVHADDGCWHLVDPTSPDTTILEASRWEPDYTPTAPVTIAQAEQARNNFPITAETHPAPHCISCGLHETSLNVHVGPIGDGRWASPLRIPSSSPHTQREGQPGLDEGLLWMAMDCACGWYTSLDGGHRRGVTVQFAVSIYQELALDTDYALVAWNGDYEPHWEGRKRGAAAALFDDSGTCVAQSRSFWIAPA